MIAGLGLDTVHVAGPRPAAGWQVMLPVLHVDWPGVGNRAGSLSSGAGSQAVIDLPMPPITQQPLADWG